MTKKLALVLLLFLLFSLTLLINLLWKFLPEQNPVFAESSPANLEEFWNRHAFFEFQNKFAFPTDGQYAWLSMNMGTDVVVRDDAWYIFTREYMLREQRPPYYSSCPGDGDIAKIVVRKSVDKGQNWTDRTVMIEPAEGKPYECSAVDGDAFFDADTTTWHYVYQCLARGGGWRVCHSTKQGDNPLGLFTDNPANPVIRGGDLWNRICDSPEDDCYEISDGRPVYDEGTPEIVEKRDEYFYITFHGFDNPHGYRGIAKTSDFVNWELVNDDAIFDKYDCQPWNVPWDANGCIGGGQAAVLKDGDYHYKLIEAADKNLGCTENQQWVYGLVRSSTLEATRWENMPGDRSAVIFSTKEERPDGTTLPCAVQYARLFMDTNGEIYLLVGRAGPKPSLDRDPSTGIYLYKLKNNIPFASYQFREGRDHEYTNSDIVIQGNPEAQTFNTQWLEGGTDDSYLLDFNGTNSYAQMPDNPIFNLDNEVSLKIRLKIRNLPTDNSALITGKVGSYWLEFYRRGNLCFWVSNNTGTHNVCAPLDLDQWHTFRATYNGSQLTLYQDGKLIDSRTPSGSGLNQSSERFKLSNETPMSGGYNGPFDGSLDYVKIYAFAASPLLGDLDDDGDIDSQDLKILLENWSDSPSEPRADLNDDDVVNGLDFGQMVKLIQVSN